MDMLFLIIPVSLILIAIIAIAVIIWRKAPYIKKLAIAESASSDGVANLSSKSFSFRLFSQLAPEMLETFRALKFHEYREAWLMELEKFLRRFRLLSLRMDRLSDSLISKVRKGYQNGNERPTTFPTEDQVPAEAKVFEPVPVVNELESFRKEEQRLIIEIAKNPKDAKLYDVLGGLYIKMGEYNDAKESFEAAIELDPANEDLKKKRSQALEKLKLSQASQN